MEPTRQIRHKTIYYTSHIPIAEMVDNYIETQEVGALCKQCSHYGLKWTCPPFAFDQQNYWASFTCLEVICQKTTLVISETLHYEEEDVELIKKLILNKARTLLDGILFSRETKQADSVALLAGSCTYCEAPCRRIEEKQCCHPEMMRYSIEALGGNVANLIKNEFELDFFWANKGSFPLYYVLVGGILS